MNPPVGFIIWVLSFSVPCRVYPGGILMVRVLWYARA